jgi:hypothetical protein
MNMFPTLRAIAMVSALSFTGGYIHKALADDAPPEASSDDGVSGTSTAQETATSTIGGAPFR